MKRILSIFILVLIFAATFNAIALAGEYTLGPGDQVLIRIENHPDLTMTVTVQPDGCISFPMAEEIPVAGLTIGQLREQLTQRLKANLANFLVSIVLVQARPLRVQVIGEVKNPGFLSLPQGSTATQAIAQAGGPTEKADLQNILLTRRGGETKTIRFKAISQGDLSSDAVLSEGDTIVVPKGTIKVSVTGEVAMPGVYEILKGSRLLDAVAAAGGPKSTASLSRIRVLEGTGTVKPAGGKTVYDGPMSGNPTVEDGYVVMVPRNHLWDVTLVASVISAVAAVVSLFIQ